MRNNQEALDANTIHESDYGDRNFFVGRHGNELHVDLTYPPRDVADTSNRVRYIQIGIVDIRASDGIRIHYDFERDGYVVEQPKPYWEKLQDGSFEHKEDWLETGFFQSWHFPPLDYNNTPEEHARDKEKK